MNQPFVTIVSGLPRSGTSMMMRMLEGGGMPVLTDQIRAPDADNPKGYYELERVKQIEHDTAWLEEARGKAVKMIGALLRCLPGDKNYRVIFMRRSIDEVLASQRQMLLRRGETTGAISDEKMAQLFAGHLERIEAWLADQPNVQVLYVHYGEVLAAPLEQAQRVADFLDGAVRPDGMAQAVDESLYRQRR